MFDDEKKEEFLRLINPIKDKLFLYAITLEKSRENAEDLVGETILLCLEKFDTIIDISCFKAYVFKTARNLFKRKRRRLAIFDVYDEMKAEKLISKHTPPDLGYDIKILYQALDKLPAKQSEAVVLFEISGFSLEEIKEIQGGTLSGAKSRVKRGREKLVEILTEKHKKINGDISKSNIETKILGEYL